MIEAFNLEGDTWCGQYSLFILSYTKLIFNLLGLRHTWKFMQDQ
jgi:hypothetical protein